MSLFNCIEDAVTDGVMDATRGRQVQAMYDSLRADYERRVGPDAARALAAEDVKRIFKERAGTKRRQATLRLQAARRNVAQMEAHRTLRGEANRADALRVFINGDENAAIVGIVQQAQALRGFYHAELGRVLSTFSRNLLGMTRNKAKLGHVVRELFGEATGDAAAAELAQAARKTLERAVRDFNAAGGDVRMIDNYGLPMAHDARKVAAAGFDAWRDAVWDRLDWHRMIDRDTGLPFAAKGEAPPRGSRGEELLYQAFQSIQTRGWARREPSFSAPGLSLEQSRQGHRVLHFRDGASWLAYNEAFGSEDPFTTIISTLDGYARDTSQMRVLGPNPQAGLAYLVQAAKKAAETAPWQPTAMHRSASEEVDAMARKARAMLDLHSGAASAPANGRIGEFMAGVRSVLVSAQLGAAAVSAVTDIGFQAVAARKVGIDPARSVTRMLGELARDPANAVRKGLIADQMANVGAGQARYMGEVFAPEIAARLSDFVMRATGLTRWTEAGRHAFQLEFFGLLADQARHPWAEVTPALRQTMARKGFTADEWDMVRSAPLHEEAGATFLIPHELRDHPGLPPGRADELAVRLMAMVHEQTEFAVPSASLEGQALFIDQTRPGTLVGELARSGIMYKSFGMSLLYNQTRRMFAHETRGGKLAYFTGMAALMTLMGGVSLQLKEIVKGRDPQPLDDWSDLGRAALQGGGLGIFGDFLASETNRFGGGLPATIAGPVFGLGGDILGVGIEGARAATGQDHHVGRAGTSLLRYNTPMTGMWYWSSAFQRGLFDNLQRLVDPEAERAWAEAERRRRKGFGNDAWWRPGEGAPRRAPELGGIVPG